MENDRINSIIASLRKDNDNIPTLLLNFKKATGMILAGMPCDFLPFEILHACGIYPFIIPPGLKPRADFRINPDIIIAPARCCALPDSNSAIQKIIVDDIPQKHGDNSLHAWKTLIDDILAKIKGKAVAISRDELRASSEKYAILRRLIRGIVLMRREKPDALPHVNLEVIFSVSLALPPELITEKLSSLLDALNDYPSRAYGNPIPALVYGRCRNQAMHFDDLEKAGFLIVEDDICGGRRSFDLSYNTTSEHLLDEIINAFSFRPFCPCLRSAASRFELLYMLIGSYGVETVIFIDDGACPARASHFAFMRPRLMRLGIDPLLLHPDSLIEDAQRYVEFASR